MPRSIFNKAKENIFVNSICLVAATIVYAATFKKDYNGPQDFDVLLFYFRTTLMMAIVYGLIIFCSYKPHPRIDSQQVHFAIYLSTLNFITAINLFISSLTYILNQENRFTKFEREIWDNPDYLLYCAYAGGGTAIPLFAIAIWMVYFANKALTEVSSTYYPTLRQQNKQEYFIDDSDYMSTSL